MLWIRGIVFDIAPEANDEVVHGPSIGILVQSPDLFENRFAGNILALVPDQMAQEFGLHQGETNGRSVHLKLELAKIDGASAELEKSVLFGLRLDNRRSLMSLAHPFTAPEQALQAREENG